MQTIKTFAFMAMVCFLLAGSVHAGVITQTCTIPVGQIPYTQNCVLNQFNATLGTLDSVTLSLGSVSGTVQPQQTNISGADLAFTNSIATIGLSLTGPDTIAVSKVSNACAGTVLAHSTNTSCASQAFSGLSAADVAGTVASYIGTGTITPVFIASGQMLSASGSGGAGSAGALFFGGDGTIGGVFTLMYSYTPPPTGTPEPATMAMLGSALIGLGLVGRKRFAR